MKDGSLSNENGDIFFVNNTVATIELENVNIENKDSEGVFLRAEAAGWGNEGSNGGNVTLNAMNQTIDGNMIVDELSTLNLYLKDGSTYNGAINTDGEAGDIYVELSEDSVWKLTGDSYITGLTCDSDSIDLNGYKLYIDGKEYESGSESTGSAVEAKVSESRGGGAMPDGEPPERPDGEKPDGETPARPDGEKSDGEPPARPDGEKPDGEPPAKPGEEKSE
jgi:hypothetical protein